MNSFLVPLFQVTARAHSQGIPLPRAGLEDKCWGVQFQDTHCESSWDTREVGGTQRGGHLQHSKDLAQSSEQQPRHLVGCQPSNMPGAKAFPSLHPDAAHARTEPYPWGSHVQGQWEMAVTLRPCQGRLPRRKYINMCPNASRSSLRLCSARRKKDTGTFPLQPPSLSLPDPAAPQVPWTTSQAEEQEEAACPQSHL